MESADLQQRLSRIATQWTLVFQAHRAADDGALSAQRALPADVRAPAEGSLDGEPDFFASWREELLDKTWRALAAFNSTYHAALLRRINDPDRSSEDMAQVLTVELQKPISAALVRKA